MQLNYYFPGVFSEDKPKDAGGLSFDKLKWNKKLIRKSAKYDKTHFCVTCEQRNDNIKKLSKL